MVQRKVTNKVGYGIQGDQEGKNKGTELKKKMKKSRSIKLSDVEGLRSSSSSSSLRKGMAQPGKPPPLNALPPAATTTTPQKKSVIKPVDGSPNYMKSTSSSMARKESSKVSSPNSLTGSDSKNLHRRSSTGSKTSSGSRNKPASARTPTRTSSFKLVRSLTKSPTFKPARASAKKCSKVALCADVNVHRDTCSSTLKDSKFPSYLELNHHGTESEGTSVIKVCPYTYCSLNGHHHTPLPPLKSFLKARRRSMKTQRSMKMEALSPRRLKPSGDATKGLKLNEEHTVLPIEPTSNGVDFIIEIYANSKGNDAEATEGSTQMDAKGTDDSECGDVTAPEHDIEMPVSESLSEGSPHSEIDFDENFIHGDEVVISKVDDDITEILHEMKNLTEGDEREGVSSVDLDQDHTMFDVIDLQWEEWHFSASEPDYEVQSSMESDLDIVDSSESHRKNLLDESVISSDGSDCNITKEVPADEAEQFVEEDIACTDTCSQVSETLCYKQVPCAEEDYEEEKIEVDLIGIFTTTTTTTSRKELDEEPITSEEKILDNGVPEADSPLSLIVSENGCTIDLKDESFESTKQFQLQSFDKFEQDETSEDYNVIKKPGDLEVDQTATIRDFCPENKLPSGETEAEKVADVEFLIGIHRDSSLKNAKEELPDDHNNRKWTIGRKRPGEDYEENKKFNPREPNFLPVVPEPDAEKVDLKHQMMDERKNAEEWMLDHALQQAVTKLTPARKRKVALLVEAFETVLPITKCETHLRRTSTGFGHGRHIQACN